MRLVSLYMLDFHVLLSTHENCAYPLLCDESESGLRRLDTTKAVMTVAVRAGKRRQATDMPKHHSTSLTCLKTTFASTSTDMCNEPDPRSVN